MELKNLGPPIIKPDDRDKLKNKLFLQEGVMLLTIGTKNSFNHQNKKLFWMELKNSGTPIIKLVIPDDRDKLKNKLFLTFTSSEIRPLFSLSV